jgi:hypothetical protein
MHLEKVICFRGARGKPEVVCCLVQVMVPSLALSNGSPLPAAVLYLTELTDDPQNPDRNTRYRQRLVEYHGILEQQIPNLEDLIEPFCEAVDASSCRAFPAGLPMSWRSGMLSPGEEEFQTRVDFAWKQRHKHGVLFSMLEQGGLLHADCIFIGDAFPPRPADDDGLVMPALAPDNASGSPPLSGAMKPGVAWQLRGVVGPTARFDLVPVPADSEAWDGGQPVEAQATARDYAALVLPCRFKLTVVRGKPQREAIRWAADAVDGATVLERGQAWGLLKDEYGFAYTPPGASSRPQPIVCIGHSTALLATSPVQEEIAKLHAQSYNAVTALSVHMAAGVGGAGPSVLNMVRAAEELFRRAGNWKWRGLDYIQVLVKIRIEEKALKKAFDIGLLPGPAEVRKGLWLILDYAESM